MYSPTAPASGSPGVGVGPDDTFACQSQSAEADDGELILSAQAGRQAKFRLDVDEIDAYVDILRRTGYDCRQPRTDPCRSWVPNSSATCWPTSMPRSGQ